MPAQFCDEGCVVSFPASSFPLTHLQRHKGSKQIQLAKSKWPELKYNLSKTVVVLIELHFTEQYCIVLIRKSSFLQKIKIEK